MKKLKNQKAITLVALVITIIILLILSGIIISSFSENNIVEKAKLARQETMQKQAIELMNLKMSDFQMEKILEETEKSDLQKLADALCEDEDVEYVLLHSNNIGSLEKITVPEGSSIFVKMKAYPYEFEINSSLKLASIDGVELEDDEDESNLVASTKGPIAFDGPGVYGSYVKANAIDGNNNTSYWPGECNYFPLYYYMELDKAYRLSNCNIIVGSPTYSSIFYKFRLYGGNTSINAEDGWTLISEYVETGTLYSCR